MKALKTLFIATALLGSAAGVQAADNFVGLTGARPATTSRNPSR